MTSTKQKARTARANNRAASKASLALLTFGVIAVPDLVLAQAANQTRGSPPNQEYYYCQSDFGSPPAPSPYGGWTYRADLWGGSYCQWQPDHAANNPPPPSAPTASNGSLATSYETPKTQTLSASGSISSYALVTQPSHGSASLSGASVTYTPAGGYIGSDLFTFKATGPGGDSNTATINVTVSAPAAPSASAGSGSTAYETAKVFSLSASGAVASYAIAVAPSHGSLSLSGNQATYTPDAGYYGPDAFQFQATGPGGTSSPATYSLTVDVPAAPTATAASMSAGYETPATITLGSVGVTSSYAISAAPAHGTINLSGDQATYTPAPGFNGADSFSFTATGPGGTSAPAAVSVSVALPGVPTAPGATLATRYEQPNSLSLSGGGVINGFAIAANPSHGSANLVGNVLTYTPAAGYYGGDSLSYVANGPGGTSAPGIIAVTVGLPPAPVALGSAAGGAVLNTTYQTPKSVTLTANGYVTSYVILGGPSHGSATISGGTLTYTPAAGFVGGDALTFAAQGPGGTSAGAVLTITVAPPGAPVVDSVALTTNEGETVRAPVRVTGEWSGVILGDTPEHGVAGFRGHELEYTPAAGFTGNDSFTILAKGPGGNSAAASVSIEVLRVSSLDAQDLEAKTKPNTAVQMNLMAQVSGDAVAAMEIIRPAQHGTVSLANGMAVYTPGPDFAGQDSFSYRARSASGAIAEANVIISVEAPVITAGAVDQTASVLAGKSVSVELTRGAIGGPFVAANVLSMTPPTSGTAVVRQEGGRFFLTYTPLGQYDGDVEIRYTLSNGNGASQPAWVRIAVQRRADPSRDREVAGLVNANAQSAMRFAAAQTGNALRRAESLHDGQGQSSFGLGLAANDEVEPGQDPMRQAQRGAVSRPSPFTDAATPGRGASPRGPLSAWISGAVNLGFRRGGDDKGKIDFTTSGVSAGVDAHLSSDVALGAGLGYGRDVSEVGDNGTKAEAESVSAFVYGSYHPSSALYVDGVAGFGTLAFDNRRYVTETGGMVAGSRRGDQVFGALTAGYEYRDGRLMLAPYGRLEYMRAVLGSYTEEGDDTYALRFHAQRVTVATAIAGVRGSYRFDLASGEFTPSFRLEYQHALKNPGAARMSYADWVASPTYVVDLAKYDSRNVVLTIGGEWLSINGWNIWTELESTIRNDAGQTSTVRAGGGYKF